MERFLQEFEVNLSRPEQYLCGSDEVKKRCLVLDQELFAHCNTGRFPTGPLNALHTKGFDNDQIWEQVQLLNQPTVKYAKIKSKEIVKMTVGHSAVLPKVDDEQSEVELLSESSSSSEELSRRLQGSSDNFFNISEMNKFLAEEDHKYQEQQMPIPQVDNFDLFREMSSEDECDQLMYDDFFDPPNDSDNCDLNNDHNFHDSLDFDVDDNGLDQDADKSSQHHSSHQKHQVKVQLYSIVICLCSSPSGAQN